MSYYILYDAPFKIYHYGSNRDTLLDIKLHSLKSTSFKLTLHHNGAFICGTLAINSEEPHDFGDLIIHSTCVDPHDYSKRWSDLETVAIRAGLHYHWKVAGSPLASPRHVSKYTEGGAGEVVVLWLKLVFEH
jgi:hypothetical protein